MRCSNDSVLSPPLEGGQWLMQERGGSTGIEGMCVGTYEHPHQGVPSTPPWVPFKSWVCKATVKLGAKLQRDGNFSRVWWEEQLVIIGWQQHMSVCSSAVDRRGCACRLSGFTQSLPQLHKTGTLGEKAEDLTAGKERRLQISVRFPTVVTHKQFFD